MSTETISTDSVITTNRLSATQIKQQIKDSQASSGKRIVDLAVEELTTREVNRRKELLLKGLDKHTHLFKEFENIRADADIRDADGNIVQTGFTPGQSQKRKDAKAKYDKVDQAISKALNDNDYSALEKVLSNSPDGQ